MPEFHTSENLSDSQLEALRNALIQRLNGPHGELPVVTYQVQLSPAAQETLAQLQGRLQQIQTLVSSDWTGGVEGIQQKLRSTLVSARSDWKAFDKFVIDAQESRVAALRAPLLGAEEQWRRLEQTTLSSSLRTVEAIKAALANVETRCEAVGRAIGKLAADGRVQQIGSFVAQTRANTPQIDGQPKATEALSDDGSDMKRNASTSQSYPRWMVVFHGLTLTLASVAILIWIGASKPPSQQPASTAPVNLAGGSTPSEAPKTEAAARSNLPPETSVASHPQPIASIAALCAPGEKPVDAMCEVLRRGGEKMCKSVTDAADKKICQEFLKETAKRVPTKALQKGAS